MKQKTKFGILAALLLTSACAQTNVSKRAPADTSNPSVDGTWSQAVNLKDLTNAYPGNVNHPRPSDGWWYAPIHATLLKNGKVAITGWLRPKQSLCEVGMGRAFGATTLFDPTTFLDPSTLAVSNVTPPIMSIAPILEEPLKPEDVLYCSGHAPMNDGRVFYVGGATYQNLEVSGMEREFGLNYARVLDPDAKNFMRVETSSPGGPHPSAADLAGDWNWYEQGMMWYPTVTRIPGGKLLISGGLSRQTGPFTDPIENRSMVFFDPSAIPPKAEASVQATATDPKKVKSPWTVWVSHENASSRVDIRAFDYPHVWLLPTVQNKNTKNFHVIDWGGKESGFTFLSLDPNVPENQRFFDPPNGIRKNADGTVANGSDTTSALLGTGEIMLMGGGQYGPKEGQRIDLYNPSTDTWRSFDTGINRVRGASTLLPDGTVLILSGERSWNGDAVGDRRQPTIFDPYAGTVKNLAAWTDDTDDRGYHNLALLLSDGRVLIGGGRTSIQDGDGLAYRIGCERSDLRIFSPPYLHKGPRPEVVGGMNAEPSDRRKNLYLKVSGALQATRAVVLMALGSETHHIDQNQRYIPLAYSVGKTDGLIKVTLPTDEQTAPEGDYFLYVMSDQGVPSLGQAIHLRKPVQ